ncbi:MAG: nucleotidyltransferase family protein [Deltaproteobacteria bacterium]|jgi:uncharacterized protein|nr:nucleotidyltransferase family protein [Deltaproteobacteria bacterium]
MKTLSDVKKRLTSHKSMLQEKYKVDQIGIFGSFIRNEQTPNSDLDILVNYTEAPDLISLIELEYYLSEILELNIDLVTSNGIKSQLKNDILKEVVYL